MPICPECELTMRRETSSGKIVFHCVCGFTKKGGPEDVLIESGVTRTKEITGMFTRFIRYAPQDPVNQIIKKDCPKCGRDYMTQIRVGSQESVLQLCKCGRKTSPDRV